MYKVLVTDSLDNVYDSPRWKVGDDNDCLKVCDRDLITLF